mgnify:CR=1 FL=1
MEEKRRSKRLDLEVTVQLERLAQGDITTVKLMKVDVSDLSSTGMGFISTVPLEIGTVYDTKIQIWTKEIVDAVVEIVRSEDDGKGGYHYGAIFIGMTDTDALKIDIYQIFNDL